MPKFEVTLGRKVVEVATVIVEAESEDALREKLGDVYVVYDGYWDHADVQPEEGTHMVRHRCDEEAADIVVDAGGARLADEDYGGHDPNSCPHRKLTFADPDGGYLYRCVDCGQYVDGDGNDGPEGDE